MGAPVRIMIVDDDPFVREVAETALSQIGSVTVRALSGGAEAVAAAPAFLPEVVVLDLAMAGMDGRETWARLCACLPRRPRLVLMTADEHAAHRDEIRELKPDGFIAKPFDPRAMTAAVSRLIGVGPVVGEDRSAAVAERFRASLGDTAHTIDTAIAGVRSGSQASRETLLAIAHRLAGSATLFGHPGLARAAERVEDGLRNLMRGAPVDALALDRACAELAGACADAARKGGAG
jgi:CheY-like chemotaxis protein